MFHLVIHCPSDNPFRDPTGPLQAQLFDSIQSDPFTTLHVVIAQASSKGEAGRGAQVLIRAENSAKTSGLRADEAPKLSIRR